MPTPYRLGIDMGTNSLGWCLLNLDEQGHPCGIVDMGVRIYSDGRNPKDGEPLAVQRRNARAMRRRRGRYLNRRFHLMKLLIEADLMPKTELDRKGLECLNPYTLRAKALDQKLERYELGRALFHLNQRRGFKSNRRSDRDEKEDGQNLQRIKELGNHLKELNCRSLGEYCWKGLQAGRPVRFKAESKFYPNRDMYLDEFRQIVKNQSRFHPEIEAQLWERLEWRIFFQHELKAPVLGRCLFKSDRTRAYRAIPSAQKFRIAQDLVNLKLVQSNWQKVPLTDEQRQTLWDALNHQKSLSFGKIKTLLRLPRDAKLNLEDAKNDKLLGNGTAVTLSGPDYFGGRWYELSDEVQDAIVEMILSEDDEKKIADRAMADWGLDEVCATNLAHLVPSKFEKGTMRFCAEVLQKLVPLMRDRGLRYDQAAVECGFHHSDNDSPVLEALPYYGDAMPESVQQVRDGSEDERRIGRINNPTVHIALNQLRKVVNAIIASYGPPTEVAIEMVRDLKLPKKVRDEIVREQKRNQDTNERLNKMLEENRLPADPENRDRLRLWEELSDDVNDRKCPYTGEQISIGKLLSESVEIEHILPFSKTLDDTRANKTVCMVRANRDKGNRSPFEAFGHDKAVYDEILARAANMPANKRWRFNPDAMERFEKTCEDGDAGWLSRQLNDTAYLAKAGKRYMACICDKRRVWAIPGRLTGFLRRKWGLNNLLGDTGEKNRMDHRHHAIDAFVIAMTDRYLLQQMSLQNANNDRRLQAPELWGAARDALQRTVGDIVVSHKPDHGVQGRLFEETAYGILDPLRDGDNLIAAGKTKKDNSIVIVRHPKQNPIHQKALIPDDIFCIDIWKLHGGEIVGVGMTRAEAMKLTDFSSKLQKPSAKRPHPAAKRLMRLHKGDMVRLEDKGNVVTGTIFSLRPSNKVVGFQPHNDSAPYKAGDKNKIFPSYNAIRTKKLRKLFVDALGRVKDPGARL